MLDGRASPPLGLHLLRTPALNLRYDRNGAASRKPGLRPGFSGERTHAARVAAQTHRDKSATPLAGMAAIGNHRPMAILSDKWIRAQAQAHGMIEPFVEAQRRDGVISLWAVLLRL